MTLDQDAASSTPAFTSPERAPTMVPPCFITLGLVGESAAMRRTRADVMRYAPKSATVLVTGETGSGKELVARALHDLSPRARAPFVAVNVATLRRELTASELFGHERGSFSGAVTSHKGLFEQAHGGTLFLDEIGELDPTAQADLLRVLETREVRPLGSSRPRTVDVRIVAATHRDLAAMVTTGEFRSDLYYRLNVLAVVTPPLRNRREDIPVLVAHLLYRLRHEAGVRHLTRDALSLLAGYPWPGNARQLLNVLRRALAHSDDAALDADVIRAAHVPVLEIPAGTASLAFDRILFADDRAAITDGALDMLASIAQASRAEVIIAHVATGKPAREQVDHTATFLRLFEGLQVRSIMVENDDVERTLLDLAHNERVGLIAVLHRHTGLWTGLFHTSTTKGIALHSAVPVLALEQ